MKQKLLLLLLSLFLINGRIHAQIQIGLGLSTTLYPLYINGHLGDDSYGNTFQLWDDVHTSTEIITHMDEELCGNKGDLALYCPMNNAAIPVRRKSCNKMQGGASSFSGNSLIEALCETIYVNGTATGNNDGSSWSDAFTDFQAALDIACSGSEIWVASGTYKPSKDHLGNSIPADSRNKVFYIPDGVEIYGGFAGTETDIAQRDIPNNESILSGDIGTLGNNADNAYHVVLASANASNGEGVGIDGFTITGGNANGSDAFVLNGNYIQQRIGGGILCSRGANMVRNSILHSNSAKLGGGISMYGGTITITGNVIHSNSSEFSGGGIDITSATVTILNNVFHSNSASAGGGVYGISSSTITITNNTFYSNSASSEGGGVYFNGGTNSLTNNIFWENTRGGANNMSGSDMGHFNGSILTVEYCITQGNSISSVGTGIINNQDPLFADPTDPDGADDIYGTADDGLALQLCSPVINMGTSPFPAVPMDILGNARVGVYDMGAYESQWAGLLTIHVNGTATGNNDGSSWSDAFTDFQAALDIACSGSEIWVASGTYKPSKDHLGNSIPADARNKVFYIPDGLEIYGGFAGTETDIAQRDIPNNESILSGDIGALGNNADNAYHVVLASANASNGEGVWIDGFTITGGNANGSDAFILNGNYIQQRVGGGILCSRGANTVTNSILHSNSAKLGGGISVHGGTITITDNLIHSNSSEFSGGGIDITSATVTILNNVFHSNSASTGGGVYGISSSTITITNNTFYSNSASSQGGGVYFNGGTNRLTNNIFWNNTRGGTSNGSGADMGHFNGSILTVEYCLTQGSSISSTGTGIINNQDPLFADPTDPDGADDIYGTADDGLALQLCSPVINMGTSPSPAVPMDILGNARVGVYDMGAYENQWASGLPTIHVNDTATGNNDGSSWVDAFTDFQDALDIACRSNITEIWVAAGTYRPSKDHFGNSIPADARNKVFYIPDGLEIYGGFAGTETDITQRDIPNNESVLSGDIGALGNNSDNAYHVVLASANTYDGEGVAIDGFTITGGNANGSDAFVLNGSIIQQRTGGGILCSRGTNTVTNSILHSNSAKLGGGIFMYGGTITITDNVIHSNSSEFSGGGIDITSATVTILNNVFHSNSASTGGGVYGISSSTITITNNTFYSNSASSEGGGVYFNGGINSLANNIFWENTRGGANNMSGSDMGHFNGSILTVEYCITQENSISSVGTGIINNQDPLFADPTDTDGADDIYGTADDGLYIMHCSNAIDSGSSTAWTSTGLSEDFVGNARLAAMVDMGAYEYVDGMYFNTIANTQNITTTATSEKTDVNDWTHYYDNKCQWLLSLKKNGNSIGTVGDGTFQLEQTVTAGYNSGSATDLSSASYVTNGGDWFVMNRYWHVTPTTQPNSDVAVRFPYHTNDYNDVMGSSSIYSHTEMVFFKLDNASNPHSTSASSLDYHQYDNGTTASTDTWLYNDVGNDIHYAEYMVRNFSGGGGGAGDGINGGALPVELTYFQARKDGETSLLTWGTTSEENNKGFRIEHSMNGRDFENIGWIDGHGNTIETQEYEFMHKEPHTGVNYYRLAQEDFDASINYSNVKTILFEADLGITVYPNPSKLKGNTNIQFITKDAEQVNVSVFEMKGKQVMSINHDIDEGSSTLSLSHDLLSNGIYIISITHNGGTKNLKLSIVE